MEKRYQVFVSSTYVDLQRERHEVMQALLEMDCMPAGMELFPAANEEQWSLIKRVIDESDYYIVISAGRYGSIGNEGLSYTEMEYRYATEQGKPVIAFLHQNLGRLEAAHVEPTDEGKRKLHEFRELMQRKLVKHWSSAEDLGSKVSRSLMQLIKQHPGIGWIRADKEALEAHAAPEILKLRQKIDELQGQLSEALLSQPPGAENLAQADDEFLVHFSFEALGVGLGNNRWNASTHVSWNQILFDVGPALLAELQDEELRLAMNAMVEARSRSVCANMPELRYCRAVRFEIVGEDFQTVKLQLRALGLINRASPGGGWILTGLGERNLSALRAIPKGCDVSPLGTVEIDVDADE
jgi:hypothetical protein